MEGMATTIMVEIEDLVFLTDPDMAVVMTVPDGTIMAAATTIITMRLATMIVEEGTIIEVMVVGIVNIEGLAFDV